MPQTTNQKPTTNNGYITLLTVIIASAVAVSVTVFILTIGTTNSKSALVILQSSQAAQLAHACAEEALQQIDDSTPYTGNGSLSLGQGDCDYSVTNTGGQNRTIEATGTVGSVVRKARVTIDKINPSINVTSWQEVADL